MPIRLSGINSGLDTDAIVKELVNAYSLKTEKYEKQQTKLEWKQEAWQNLNTKIYGLYTNVSNLRYSSAYNLRRVSVSDPTKATITASDSAVTGTQMLEIKKTAQASYITGGKLGDDVTAKTKLSELGFVEDGETTLELQKGDGTTTEIKVTRDTTIAEFVSKLSEAGVNASFDANNKRFFISAKESGVKNDFNLYAKDDNGKEILSRLGLNTALVDEKGNFTAAGAAKYQSAIDLYQAAEAAGQDIAAYLREQITDYEALKTELEALEADKKTNQETVKNYEKLLAQKEARAAHNATYSALSKAGLTVRDDGNGGKVGINSFQLRDMVKTLYADGELTKEELTKYVENPDNGITLADDQSVDDLYATLLTQKDNMKLSADYSKKYNDLTSMKPDEIQAAIDAIGEDGYKQAMKDIADGDIAIAAKKKEIENHPYKDVAEAEDVDAAIAGKLDDVLEALNVLADNDSRNGGAIKITGTDAEIVLNGATFTNATNSFSINGLNIEAQAETNGAISVTTTVDTQGIYDKIKDFLTEYNNVVNEMTKLYNADTAKGYEPLTDDERDAMSDTEIEKWEAKIKSALLRRDASLDSILSTMVNAMSQSVTVNGEKLSLGSFGIQTLGFLNAVENQQYAYHIDGDKDDASSSDKTDKLMAAIQEDPDQVAEFMKGLCKNLYEAVDKKMKSTSMSSAYKVYNDKEIDKQLDEYDDLIKKWEDKVADQEDYYYNKFSQMEVAMSKLQSQTNSLAGLLG